MCNVLPPSWKQMILCQYSLTYQYTWGVGTPLVTDTIITSAMFYLVFRLSTQCWTRAREKFRSGGQNCSRLPQLEPARIQLEFYILYSIIVFVFIFIFVFPFPFVFCHCSVAPHAWAGFDKTIFEFEYKYIEFHCCTVTPHAWVSESVPLSFSTNIFQV